MEILQTNKRVGISYILTKILVKFRFARIWVKLFKRDYWQRYNIAIDQLKNIEDKLNDCNVKEKYPNISLNEWKNHFFFCAINYGASLYDYFHFEMYLKNELALNNYVSSYNQWHDIIPKFNGDYYGESTKVLRDKDLFAEKFGDLLGRDFIKVDKDLSYSEFEDFFYNKEKVLIKPRSGSCQGNGIKLLHSEDFNSTDKRKELFWELQTEDVLIEDFLKQTGILHDFNPLTVNTVRIATVNNKNDVSIAFAGLSIGVGDSVTDQNSLIIPVDIKTGILVGQAEDDNCNKYYFHPYTGIQLIGQKVPNWENALKIVKEAARRIPEVPFIGWDVAIGENGVFLIEGNQGTSIQHFEFPWEYGFYSQFQKYSLDLCGCNFDK